jgi:hypothetical protein
MPIQAPKEYHPAALGIGMERLHPVERGRRVGKLAGAVVEIALAAADAAEIEAQRGEAALLKHIEEIVDDLVVHRAAELRMRMQDERDRSVLLLRRLIPALETAGRPRKDNLWHFYSTSDHTRTRTRAGLDAGPVPP